MPRNLLFNRFYNLREPIENLNTEQQTGLEEFKSKLSKGYYEFEDATCICGSRDGKLIAQRDRYALPVNTYLCCDCGIMWTSPRMTPGSLQLFYEQDYRAIYVGSRQASEEFFSEQISHGRNILRYISSQFDVKDSRVVFDVGCGSGGILIPFAESGWSVYGCDLGGEYLVRGLSYGLNLVKGGVNKLKLHGPANLVILSHVLEHLPEPLVHLQEISDVLDPDGYVYIELPGILNIWNAYGDTLLFLQNAHLYHFTLETLSGLMARAGFHLITGDQSIRALFKKDKTIKFSLVKNTIESKKICWYLRATELKRILKSNQLFGSASSINVFLVRILYSIRSMIVASARGLIGDSVVNQIKRKLRR